MIIRRSLFGLMAGAMMPRDVAFANTASSDPILGVDISSYPGDDIMAKLQHEQKRRFTGLYLTHWSQKDNQIRVDQGWIKKRTFLSGKGWGFIPTYLGVQSPQKPTAKFPKTWPMPTESDGLHQGAQAANLMRAAEFAPGSVVYLDIEFPIGESSPYMYFVKAWQEAVSNAGYYPGIYCSYTMLPWISKYTKAIWMFELPFGATVALDEEVDLPFAYDPNAYPFGQIREGALCTQYLQNKPLNGFPKGMMFDSSSSLIADPSNLPGILEALSLSGVDLEKDFKRSP